uniref:uncharacterized protein LOC117603555 n=1 Tax=Osmia lignaria TaxID=473952 RepID=UPI0014796452|nr:uncharacterized protein LOC117603555 [Osmia lignaria]
MSGNLIRSRTKFQRPDAEESGREYVLTKNHQLTHPRGIQPFGIRKKNDRQAVEERCRRIEVHQPPAYRFFVPEVGRSYGALERVSPIFRSALKITSLKACARFSWSFLEEDPRDRSFAAIAPPGLPWPSTLQPRQADLHHGYELVRARGGYITEQEREREGYEQDGKRETEKGASRASAFHPQRHLAGGSSDTHNNHNNGIPRVTRGPPPRIGTAPSTAYDTPST